MHETGVVERHHDVECMTPCKPHFKDTAMEQPFYDLGSQIFGALFATKIAACTFCQFWTPTNPLPIMYRVQLKYVALKMRFIANTMISDISNIFKYYQ